MAYQETHQFYLIVDCPPGERCPAGTYWLAIMPMTRYRRLLVTVHEKPKEAKEQSVIENVLSFTFQRWVHTERVDQDTVITEDLPLEQLELPIRAGIELSYVPGIDDISTYHPESSCHQDYCCVSFKVRVADPTPVLHAALRALDAARIPRGSVQIHLWSSPSFSLTRTFEYMQYFIPLIQPKETKKSRWRR